MTLSVEIRGRPRAGLHTVHLDALLTIASLLRGGRRRQPTRETPVEQIDRLDAPGLLHLDIGGQRCHACSALVASPRGVRWRMYGARSTVRRAIKLMWGPENRVGGELTIDGHAYPVRAWRLEHADYDLEDCVVWRGRAIRHLPESWVASASAWGRGAHEGPYWHPGRQHRLPRLGEEVELTQEVLAELRRLDLHHTQEAEGGARGELQDRIGARLQRLASLTGR